MIKITGNKYNFPRGKKLTIFWKKSKKYSKKETLAGYIIKKVNHTVIISKSTNFVTCLIWNNSYLKRMNLKNLAMWAVIVFLTIGLYNMFRILNQILEEKSNYIFRIFNFG